METKEQIVKLERKAGNVVIRQNGNILDRLFGSRRDATQRPVSMAGIAKTNEWVKRKCNQLSPTSVNTSCLRQKFDRNIEEEHPCDVAIVSPNQFHSLGKCRLWLIEYLRTQQTYPPTKLFFPILQFFKCVTCHQLTSTNFYKLKNLFQNYWKLEFLIRPIATDKFILPFAVIVFPHDNIKLLKKNRFYLIEKCQLKICTNLHFNMTGISVVFAL